MSYVVESVEGSKKKITFNFAEVDLTDQIKKALQKKRSTVAIKGFRKGKAPLSMIEKMYRPEIESHALGAFVQDNYMNAINSEKIRVAGQPIVENMKYDPGKTISFDCFVEVFPEITLKDMSDLKFTKDKIEVSEEEVEKVKKSYLESKAEMVPLEGDNVTLEKGHHSVINFQGIKEDGERPENMKGSEFALEIGSNSFIPGFEDGMVGMKKGETKSIEVTFPEEYQAKDLQGAKVTFEVELLDIKDKKWPELTEELAKEFGFDSPEDFMTKNRERLIAGKEKEAEDKLRKDIMEKLVSENVFDVPASLLDRQKDHVRDGIKQNLIQQGFSEDMAADYFTKWDDDITEKATFELKSGLILDKLSNEFEITATEDDFNKKIAEMASSMSLPEETVKQFYAQGEAKNNMMYTIREEKTFDKIKSQVVVL